MGWFKGDATEQPGQFIVGGGKVPERHYGYLSVRWSVDNALGMIEIITTMEPGNGATSLVTRIKANPWTAMVLIETFYMSMYLAYAEIVLNVSERALAEMNIGFLDGIKALLGPDEKPYDTKIQSFIQQKAQDFRFAIKTELNSKIELGNVDFTGGPTCDILIRSLCTMYSTNPTKPDTFDAMESTRLVLLFGHQPAKFMHMLKDDLHISYRVA